MKKFMKLATLFSAILGAVFLALYLYTQASVFEPLAITFATIFYHFAMRLGMGGVFQCAYTNKMDYKKAWFCTRNFEIKLYEIMKVKGWKKHLPTYDEEAFDLKTHTYKELVMATCQAELVHETIVVLSFLPIFASQFVGSAGVFIATSVVSAVIDLVFVILQRYNRPRLIRIMRRAERG